MAEPLIYLYTEHEQTIEVGIDERVQIHESIPAHRWKIKANPLGEITFLKDGSR